MGEIAGVGSGAVSNVQLQAMYQARVASLTKDAAEMEGDMALKLIESASVEAGVGEGLDIRV